ncbi:MAG: signal peptidase I [Bacilli bacterium]|nr:signal peptidase I [Bacilli bacterium]
MDKKGKVDETIKGFKRFRKQLKSTYLYKLISGFLSIACTIILAVLLVVGALMFFFNMKAKSYKEKGLEYTTPFGLYTIISPSMEPNVSVYDVIVAVDQDISKIKVGDVITFISNWEINYNMTITHRVVAINKNENGEYQLTTKGDNNGTADGGTVTQSNLIGKVVGRIPQLGRLQFFLATKMGWFLVVFIPAIIIVIVDMIKIFKLYVLKNQIDEVKPQKEAQKEKMAKELDSISSELKEPNKQLIKARKLEDQNIDTVELPKVDSDGLLKENTLEIPIVKEKQEDEGYSIGDIVLSHVIEEDVNNKPILRKKLDVRNDNEDNQRKMLKKREK